MRTVILGGGFGGLAVAATLRRLDPSHDVVLVDRSDAFVMGFRKLWELTGLEGGLEGGTRSRTALRDPSVQFIRTTVRKIDPVRRRVETDAGGIEGDVLVVALGAEPRGDLVPGLAAHGTNLYDTEEVSAGAARVAALQSGRVAVSIAGIPYKCPPAPYEAVMLLHEHFRRRGVRDRIELTFTTFQPALLPNAGPAGHRWIADHLGERSVAFRVGWPVERLEAGRLVSGAGDLPFDLAFVVPPHRPPSVVAESGLTGEGGWVAVDRGTLATVHPGVYAIGDCVNLPLTGGGALPKAGVMAEAQGMRVAAAIAAQVRGDPPPPPYDGHGACFLELGSGEAAMLRGDFFAEAGPEVRILDSSPQHAEEKRRFERERLAEWFA